MDSQLKKQEQTQHQNLHTASGNDAWIARSLRAVWHPCTQMKHHERLPLVAVSRGAGPWLYDHEDRRYLDAISSWWVNLFGHANPAINAGKLMMLTSCVPAWVMTIFES